MAEIIKSNKTIQAEIKHIQFVIRLIKSIRRIGATMHRGGKLYPEKTGAILQKNTDLILKIMENEWNINTDLRYYRYKINEEEEIKISDFIEE